MKAADLQERLNEIYNAWQGPPRAYIEIETNEAEYSLFRFVYKVYALGIDTVKTDERDHENTLCEEMLRRFTAHLSATDMEDKCRTLIWRRNVEYTAEPVLVMDDTGDYVPHPTRMLHQLYLRAYCPSVSPAYIRPEGQRCELLPA